MYIVVAFVDLWENDKSETQKLVIFFTDNNNGGFLKVNEIQAAWKIIFGQSGKTFCPRII